MLRRRQNCGNERHDGTIGFRHRKRVPTDAERLSTLLSRLLPVAALLVHGVLLCVLCVMRARVSASPDLAALLRAVDEALRRGGVEVWVAPGAQLSGDSTDAELSSRHRTLALGAWHGSELRVARALALAPDGEQLAYTETHAGLRIFHAGPTGTNDYRLPFVDIVYYRQDGPMYVNHCCACAAQPPPIGACTKKTCGCMKCVVATKALLPLRPLRVDGVALLAPHDVRAVMRRDAPHPYESISTLPVP